MIKQKDNNTGSDGRNGSVLFLGFLFYIFYFVFLKICTEKFIGF